MNAQIHSLFASTLVWTCILWSGQVWSADAIPGEEACDRPVAHIVFSGNRITKPQVLLREIHQEKNALCSIDLIVDSIQSIMDLGLFKTVLADLSVQNDELQLRFTVTEKLYFLAIPRISRTSDGELRAGMQLRFDNFLGRLHELRVTSERRKEDDGDGPGGFVHRLGYNIPRFFGSDYGMRFELSSDRRQLHLLDNGTKLGLAQSETQSVGVVFSRWTNKSKGVYGLRYFYGAKFAHRALGIVEGEAGPYVGGQDLSVLVGFENRRVHQDEFRRSGSLLGGSVTASSSATGSDFNYTRVDLYAAAFLPLRNGIRNINVRARLGLSDGAAFGENSYHIGGGAQLRGLQPGSASGDMMALLNIEYLHAWFNHPQWRWVAFTDIGNVYRRDAIDLLHLRGRIGLGLRWKLRSLANTDIRLDVAWDPLRAKFQSYLSSNLTF